jgi:hypothetical protein
MNAAAEQTPTSLPGAGFPSRLLAIRRAGAAFAGPFALRSSCFEALLGERAALLAERTRTRDDLLCALHLAVPRAADRDERRLLVRTKRDVFNLRRPSASSLAPGLAPGLAALLARYQLILEREAALFVDRRAEVLTEQRRALSRLLDDECFRSACRYSSADLWEEVERYRSSLGRENAAEYSTLERGLYAYAIRFASKANPLHLFAGIAFAPSSGMETPGGCEVVLDASVILELEREVRPHVVDGTRVWLSLRPFRADGDRYRFWAASARGFRVLSLPRGRWLGAMTDFFAHQQHTTGRPVGTRAECEAYLQARLGAGRPEEVAAPLSALVENGIVSEYLVTDLGAFGRALSGAEPATDARVQRLQEVHLSRLDVHALAEAEGRLAPDGEADRPRYYVNRYARVETDVHEAAAAALYDDLRVLKPFFCEENNFSPNSAVASAFLLERLGGGGAAPLLDLLGPFIRELDTLIQRFHPDIARAGEVALRRSRSAALAAESGSLDRTQLARLLPQPLPPARSLCFNGPFDYERGIFYLSNVWAGDGRFISRYLLHRRSAPADGRRTEPGVIDVELAVPPDSNLNYVVRTYSTGCGFESRYSHQFDQWIDPAEIVVEAAGGEVVYRLATTGNRLRIHYHGFLLAQYLPAEYQILLVGHADTFHNPFRGPDTLAEQGGIRRVEALHHGAVCLRRERWVVPAPTLAGPLADADPLRRTARLRDLLHERLLVGVDDWYYRTSDVAGKGYKPQYLDLRNPLGVTSFRRAVAGLPDGGSVSLSPMQPVPAHLHHDEGVPYVTELMVET